MQYRYISDLHLYDIYSMEWRGKFGSFDNYALNLINTWNSNVSKDDVVIVVGDIGYYCEKTVKVLNSLRGTKVLIIGNHDLAWGKNLYTCNIFSGIHHTYDCNGIHLEHTPNGNRGNCQWYIHGHHHRYDMPGMTKVFKEYFYDTYRLNCSADLLDNKPCTLQELIIRKELLIDSTKIKEEN